jgi:hypothetical protein
MIGTDDDEPALRWRAALAWYGDMRVIAKEPYRIVPEGVAVEPRPAER